MKLSDEQRRVLRRLHKLGRGTPRDCKTGTRTFVALAERKLIYVGTTFAAIAYPLTSAEAELTDAGREAIGKH